MQQEAAGEGGGGGESMWEQKMDLMGEMTGWGGGGGVSAGSGAATTGKSSSSKDEGPCIAMRGHAAADEAGADVNFSSPASCRFVKSAADASWISCVLISASYGNLLQPALVFYESQSCREGLASAEEKMFLNVLLLDMAMVQKTIGAMTPGKIQWG